MSSPMCFYCNGVSSAKQKTSGSLRLYSVTHTHRHLVTRVNIFRDKSEREKLVYDGIASTFYGLDITKVNSGVHIIVNVAASCQGLKSLLVLSAPMLLSRSSKNHKEAYWRESAYQPTGQRMSLTLERPSRSQPSEQNNRP